MRMGVNLINIIVIDSISIHFRLFLFLFLRLRLLALNRELCCQNRQHWSQFRTISTADAKSLESGTGIRGRWVG